MLPPAMHPTRRQWLHGAAGLGAGALLARPLAAQPPDPFGLDFDEWNEPTTVLTVDLPQLQYSGQWNPRPGAMRELASELRLRTRLEPVHEPSAVLATAPALFSTPFLYVAGERGLPPMGEPAEAQLGRFLDLGGMIVFDAADGGADGSFERDVQALLARIVPGAPVTRIARDHVLYRSFYIIDEPVGRTRSHDHALGVQEEGRLKVLLIRNDLGGALARNPDGLYTHPCTPGGPAQREWAIRFAVNILLYATCTDYKADRAHVETLLRNRRWR